MFPLVQYLLRLFQVPSYAFQWETALLRWLTIRLTSFLRLPEDGLTIQNPEGYSSEYLLYAAKLLVDLDMKTLIKSMGKTLEIEQALLSRFDALLGVQHYFSGLFPQDLSCQKAQSV